MNNSLNAYPVFEDNRVLCTQLNELASYLLTSKTGLPEPICWARALPGLTLKYTVLSGYRQQCAGVNQPEVRRRCYQSGLHNECRWLRSCSEAHLHPSFGVDYPHFSSFTSPIYEVLTVNARSLKHGQCNTHYRCQLSQDRVLVLFLETVDVDLNSCLGKACDENGLERVFNLLQTAHHKGWPEWHEVRLSRLAGFLRQQIHHARNYHEKTIAWRKEPNWYNTMANISAIFRNTVSANFNNPTNNKTYYTTIFSKPCLQTYQIFSTHTR